MFEAHQYAERGSGVMTFHLKEYNTSHLWQVGSETTALS